MRRTQVIKTLHVQVLDGFSRSFWRRKKNSRCEVVPCEMYLAVWLVSTLNISSCSSSFPLFVARAYYFDDSARRSNSAKKTKQSSRRPFFGEPTTPTATTTRCLNCGSNVLGFSIYIYFISIYLLVPVDITHVCEAGEKSSRGWFCDRSSWFSVVLYPRWCRRSAQTVVQSIAWYFESILSFKEEWPSDHTQAQLDETTYLVMHQ